MTKFEFEQLVKKSVTFEEYDRIEAIYMDIPLEKDKFCKSWKGNRDVILDCMHVKICSQELRLQEVGNNLKKEIIERQREKAEIVDKLVELANETSMTSVRDYAISLSSRKDYLVAKMDKGYKLWGDEIDWIKEILETMI